MGKYKLRLLFRSLIKENSLENLSQIFKVKAIGRPTDSNASLYDFLLSAKVKAPSHFNFIINFFVSRVSE